MHSHIVVLDLYRLLQEWRQIRVHLLDLVHLFFEHRFQVSEKLVPFQNIRSLFKDYGSLRENSLLLPLILLDQVPKLVVEVDELSDVERKFVVSHQRRLKRDENV